MIKDSAVYFSSNRNSLHADIYRSSLVVEMKGVSQSRIDSLLKEANSILDELQDIRGQNTKELILLFEYNVFSVSEFEKSEIELILDRIEDKGQAIVQLNSFSFEDYSEQSKKLMILKREQKIIDYLQEFGIPLLNIKKMINKSQNFERFSSSKIGGVHIKISY